MPAFVPGLELNRAFYQEAVAPLVKRWSHAAARIGFGSEVLGFDDQRSTDHGWGPRLQIFVSPSHVQPAQKVPDEGLPETFRAWPVRYGCDEIGSHLVVARVVRELMRVVFLLSQRYWPYTKWFGSAFARLPGADGLTQLVDGDLSATGYPAREEALVSLYQEVAARHNQAGLSQFVDEKVRRYYGRPYLVLQADRFVAACLAPSKTPPSAVCRWWVRSIRSQTRRTCSPTRHGPGCSTTSTVDTSRHSSSRWMSGPWAAPSVIAWPWELGLRREKTSARRIGRRGGRKSRRACGAIRREGWDPRRPPAGRTPP